MAERRYAGRGGGEGEEVTDPAPGAPTIEQVIAWLDAAHAELVACQQRCRELEKSGQLERIEEVEGLDADRTMLSATANRLQSELDAEREAHTQTKAIANNLSAEILRRAVEFAAERKAHAETWEKLENNQLAWHLRAQIQLGHIKARDQRIRELEATLAADVRTVAQMEAELIRLRADVERWKAGKFEAEDAHSETLTDRDQLRAECARLRAELLAYVESNNVVRVENG